MFDLTKEISLEPASRKLYQKFQVTLYLVAFFSALYLSYLIIFPHKYFSFSFLNPSSGQNNITTPRLTNGDNFSNGHLTGGNNFYFDTTPEGDYSYATIALNMTSSTEKPSGLNVTVRKSYQAFMYNLGSPIGFRDGSLLKNSGRYFIVSDSNLRKFEDVNVLLALGYSEKNFQDVSNEELVYNPFGADITLATGYVNDTLFRIADNYYILAGGKLQKFVSDQAYSTQYEVDQAITKEAGFLNNYSLADDSAGFADGTLVANGGSVFIISAGKILPIDNPQTFAEKGYSWNDVLNVGEDEIAIYQKDKLFNIKSIHPDGTIFKTVESSKYYMIYQGEKHLLPGAEIAASWLKKEPVTVSEQALTLYAECSPKNSFWQPTVYICQIPLDKFSGIVGFDYEFKLKSTNNIQMNSLSINYKKGVTKANFKSFFRGLYNSIITTYVPSAQTL